MKLDKNWKAPPGMTPELLYPDGVTGVPRVGMAYSGEFRNSPLFWVGENHEDAPVLPLRASGEILLRGWDIPVQWAIDGAGNAYMDNAHGGCMSRCKPSALLGEAETLKEKNQILEALGRPLEKPETEKLQEEIKKFQEELKIAKWGEERADKELKGALDTVKARNVLLEDLAHRLIVFKGGYNVGTARHRVCLYCEARSKTDMEMPNHKKDCSVAEALGYSG